MRAVRVGVIGTGHIARYAHLPALAPLVESGEVVLQALCDVDPEALKERAAEYRPAATYGDFRRMLDSEELDAVYVCLPPTRHTGEVRETAERGIHLFVEKPVSFDAAEAVETAAVIERAGIVSQVGFQFRYYPSAEAARKLLLQRTPRHASLQMFYSGKPLRWWTSRYEECGGSFVENTIHMVDLLRYLLGDIADVSAFYQWRRPGEGPEPMNLPHVYTVNFRFVSGLLANASTARVLYNDDAGPGRRALTVVGDDSIVEWSSDRVVENGTAVFEDEEAAGGGRNCQALQASAFVAAVRAEDPAATRSPYPASVNSLVAVLGANCSAERGGELLSLEDVAAGRVSWNRRAAAGQGIPPLE